MRRLTSTSLVLLLILASFAYLPAPASAAWPAPVADAGDDQTVSEGEDVTLDGSNSYDLNDDPLTFWWDFDDSAGNGSNDKDATGAIVTTSYAEAGIYTATLHVSDGSRDDTDTCRITVIPGQPENIPPTAFIREPLPGVYNRSEPINFTGEVVDPDDEYFSAKWDFGDDHTANGFTARHTYSSDGPYLIRFTVNEKSGEYLIEVYRCPLSKQYSDFTCTITSAIDEGVFKGLNPRASMNFKRKKTSGFPTCMAYVTISSGGV